MVTIEQLRKLYYAEPFKPFVIVHQDGRRIPIEETVRFSYSDVSNTLVFVTGEGIDWAPFDAVSIEPMPAKSRRRRKAS